MDRRRFLRSLVAASAACGVPALGTFRNDTGRPERVTPPGGDAVDAQLREIRAAMARYPVVSIDEQAIRRYVRHQNKNGGMGW